jgi:two-component system, OmpR family, alkaline phosphatase synthesis response regulator PhoP
MKKQKILVVDDSELVLTMARDALEGGGFEVVTATTGIEANRYIFTQNAPDAIVLDVMLPMLDGNKKAKILKESSFSRNIPILLISSKPEDELRRLVQESGADGYIRKPFTSRDIVARVQEAIRQTPAR